MRRRGEIEMDFIGLIRGVLEPRLEKQFDKTRPAVQAAKDRKAIVAEEQAKLKKEQAALDKKLKKQRNKQAEKIYKMRQEGDYEGSIAAIDEAAFANYKEIAANKVKMEELQAKADAAIEEKVEAKAEQVKKEAIAFVEKENK